MDRDIRQAVAIRHETADDNRPGFAAGSQGVGGTPVPRPAVAALAIRYTLGIEGAPAVSDARKLKGLETENSQLKKILVVAMLDNAALKDLFGKG